MVFCPTGQLVTDGAHEVMVYTLVEYTVDVEPGALVAGGGRVTADDGLPVSTGQ